MKVKGGKGTWATILKNATKFQTIEKASNFVEQNFAGMYRSVPVAETKILNMDNLTEEYQNQDIDLNNEKATELLDELRQFFNAVSEETDKFIALPGYFGGQIKHCDMETLDLLHTIELTNENVVAGYKRYKQLQEIRQRRRIAKDSLEVCSLLLSSGLLPALKQIKLGLEEIEKWKETRTYSPRVREGMFDDPEYDEDEIA